MVPSDGQILSSISYETIFGYVAIGAVVSIGIKRVVADSPQAGVRGVQRTAFLIEIRVGHIQHKAALVTPREFGLERVGTSMPEVSIGQQKLSHQRKGQSSQVLCRVRAVSLCRVANRDTVSLSFAKRSSVRSKFIQVLTCDQAAHVCPEVRHPQSSVANNLTFKCGVVLLDSGRLDVYRYGVRGNRIAKQIGRASCK